MSGLKILVVGPKECGKTIISNFISDHNDRMMGSQEAYKPTVGTRILECDKNIDRSPIAIEIWDCSGDQCYESCWPAIMKGSDGVIIVYNPDDHGQEQEVALWYEWFVQNPGLELNQCTVFAHSQVAKSHFLGGSAALPKSIQVTSTSYDSPAQLKNEFDSFLTRVHETVAKNRK